MSDSKIFIDDDWKRQAHEEKQRLAEQEEKTAAPKAPSAGKPEKESAEGAAERELPPASFETLVSTLTSQALLALGVVDHPSMGRTLNLDMAKFNIDLLGIIEEKTKGNLSDEEKRMLEQTLHQLRMMFVEISTQYAGPLGKR